MTPATYTPPNLGSLTGAPVLTHKCGPGGSYTFDLQPTKRETVTQDGTEVAGVQQDHNVISTTNAATRTDFDVGVAPLLPPSAPQKAVTVQSSDESVLASPVDGVAIGVSSGAATLIARAADGEVSCKRVTVSVVSSKTVTFATGPAEGSLNKHCGDQIESRIAGRGRDSMDLWRVRNNATSSYEWNPECWGADISNITCLSPYNTGTGNGGGGALITPRHVMFTQHLNYYPGVGKKIRYVTPGNVTEEFTITDVLVHENNVGFVINWWDVVICKLDRDVPDSIKFAKALPANPQPYLPTLPVVSTSLFAMLGYRTGVIPWLRICHTTQKKRLATGFVKILPIAIKPKGSGDGYDYVYYVNGTRESQPFPNSRYPDNPLGDDIVTGDSGAPAFAVVNNELVLLSLWTTPFSGFPYYADASTINGMLDELGGGYNLTEVDLSGFPTW